MEKYRLKSSVVDALQYNGDLKPIKKMLGIKDARYDQKSREFILDNGQVVKVGDWVTIDEIGCVNKWDEQSFQLLFEKNPIID